MYMARLRATKSKDINYYSIIEDYYRNGKRTTKTLVTLGSDNKILQLASQDNVDVKTYLNNYLNKYNEEHQIVQEPEEVIIKKYSNKLYKRYLLFFKNR